MAPPSAPGTFLRTYRDLLLGLAVVALPYLVCLFGYTFAPLDTLQSTVPPFTEGNPAFPQSHFWSDTVNLNWPRMATLSRGEFPVSFAPNGGCPVYADTASSFFSPCALLTFGLFKPTTATLTCFWGLQSLTIYLGTWLWLRRAGASSIGSTVGAVTQSFTTAYLTGTYLAFQSLGAMCFLPWALWAEYRFEKMPQRFAVPQLFLSLSVLGGHLQSAVFPLLTYGLWCVVQRRFWQGAYSITLVVLFTLPFWLTGVEYHIFENATTLASRQSEMPVSWLGRFKTMLALPAVLVPEAFGSSKSIDFLKVFQTSGTYFIGSIGILAPLVVASARPRQLFRHREALFGAALIGCSLLVMGSPLLLYLYYRVLCLVCLGLSVLVAFALEDSGETLHPKRLDRWCWGAFGLLAVLALVVQIVKTAFSVELTRFFTQRLQTGTYSWWGAWQEERVRRWFSGYCSDYRFGFILLALLAAPWVARKRGVKGLAVLIAADCIILWISQISWNAAREPQHPAFARIHEELKTAPAYPLARYVPLRCGAGMLPFRPAVNEYQGVPSGEFYGTTRIRGILDIFPEVLRDEKSRTIGFRDLQPLSNGGFQVFILAPGWSMDPAQFEPFVDGKDFVAWRLRDPNLKSRGVWGSSTAGDPVRPAVLAVQADRTGIALETRWPAAVEKWQLSLPAYPGWEYQLDGKTVLPTPDRAPVPGFTTPITPGDHRIEARFKPRMIRLGLLGTAASVLGALGAMVVGWRLRAASPPAAG
jgi:hypothetical protein